MLNKIIWKIRGKIDCIRYKKELRDQIGCWACKHFFTYYKREGLCACHAHEVIDCVGGIYIELYMQDCDLFEFTGDPAWLDSLDLEEEETK